MLKPPTTSPSTTPPAPPSTLGAPPTTAGPTPPVINVSDTSSSSGVLTTSPETSPEVVQIVKKPNYAQKAGMKKTDNGRKWIVIELIKSETEPHFSLNDNELGKLVYKRLRIDPKKFFRFDESWTGKIRLLVADDVDFDDNIKNTSFQIREGLKTRPLNEVGVVDNETGGTWIRMFWIHSDTKAETIKKELETFGEIIGDIKFMVFRNRDNMSEEARMLAANNVERGDTRVFRMKRKRDIPRYAWIDGTKVKIMYEGQPVTCIRCHEPVIGGCLGGGVRKKCRELVPEILRDSEQWKRKKNMETVAIDEEGKLGGDVLEFYNVPADMTNVVLADWIRLRSGSIIDPNTLSYTPVAKVRLLNKGGLEEDEVFNIVKTCNRVKIEGGAFIRVNAVQLLTPAKKPKPEEECLEGEDEDGVDRGKEDGSREAARRNLHGALKDSQVSGAIDDKEAEEVSINKEETVVDQTETVEGDETVVETVAKSKVLNVAPPEEVPESFSEYLSDSTATAEEGGDKSAAVPTSVIQSVPKADTEKEEAENLEENPDGFQRYLSERTSSRPRSIFTSNSWRYDAT